MEMIVLFVVVVVLVGALAMRFGSDTRQGVCSPEQTCAQFGFTWGSTVPEFLHARSISFPQRAAQKLRWRATSRATSNSLVGRSRSRDSVLLSK
jgi:hypothetical protein